MAFDLATTAARLVCTACGTQFPTADPAAVATCFVCDDPRQYTRPTGQAFTTLAALRATHRNHFRPLPTRAGETESGATLLTSVETTPKFAIGQRALLVRTPAGANVLWDCLPLLDEATRAEIERRGGLAAIVISHPHYYSTHADWARAFRCPVYLSAADREWVAVACPEHQVFLDQVETVVRDRGGADTGVRAIRLGGHFPGSMVLLASGRLLVADTLLTTPAGLGNWAVDARGRPRPGGRPRGMNSFAFLWSIPNAIPLGAAEVARMWGILRAYEFGSTHGAFAGQDIVDEAGIRRRVLESMQIQVRAMGWEAHPLLSETA